METGRSRSRSGIEAYIQRLILIFEAAGY